MTSNREFRIVASPEVIQELSKLIRANKLSLTGFENPQYLQHIFDIRDGLNRVDIQLEKQYASIPE